MCEISLTDVGLARAELWNIDQAEALVLARHLLGCSERTPRRRVCPVGNGVHIAIRIRVLVSAYP